MIFFFQILNKRCNLATQVEWSNTISVLSMTALSTVINEAFWNPISHKLLVLVQHQVPQVTPNLVFQKLLQHRSEYPLDWHFQDAHVHLLQRDFGLQTHAPVERVFDPYADVGTGFQQFIPFQDVGKT
ncbi:hypothetical protein T4E_2657 [Trichinella pseudospiralis]|uniref:Uncharacterized protein n=1 Tax=Trichinella pseudospiralis TaxID=6337 RepID=A0A0V0XJ58_TRIPS|nr:hypothetical protein T4E_2657 [Trichinella pseudospiralis]